MPGVHLWGSVVLKLWVLSFPISFMVEIFFILFFFLNLMWLLSLSWCGKTEWRAVDMASSVDLLVLNWHYWGSRSAGMFSFRALNQFLRALLSGPQSGSHVDSRLCRYRDGDGCFEAGVKVSCEREMLKWADLALVSVHGQVYYLDQQPYSKSLLAGFFSHPLWLLTVAGGGEDFTTASWGPSRNLGNGDCIDNHKPPIKTQNQNSKSMLMWWWQH